jgi:hypothetical protein
MRKALDRARLTDCPLYVWSVTALRPWRLAPPPPGPLAFQAFSVAALGSHAIARKHVISNKQASPKTLAKSTAIGPKAMRNSNGFMRIVISPPGLVRNHRPHVLIAVPLEARVEQRFRRK